MGVILYLGNENFDVSQEIYRLGIQSNCRNMKSDSIGVPVQLKTIHLVLLLSIHEI